MKSKPYADQVVTITSRKPLIDIPLGELWQYRDLMLLMIRRDIISTHKQTVLGPLWLLLQPIISTMIYALIFGSFANLPTDGIPKFLFYMSGIVLWYYFSNVLSRVSNTFSANSAIFSKVYFPRLCAPLAQGVGTLALFIPQLLMFLCFYLFFWWKGAPISMNYRVVIVPFLLLEIAMLGIGVGCIIAALTTKFKDLQMAVAPSIQLWMYASCIFYPRSMVPDQYQWMMSLNPVVSIVEAFRFAVMGQGEVEFLQWAIGAAVATVVFIIGISLLGRAARTVVDTI